MSSLRTARSSERRVSNSLDRHVEAMIERIVL
jgi:hypothetical protein